MRSVGTTSENPELSSREMSAQLDALLDSFPYFQSGHLLYIKNLHNQGSFLYNNQLKTAAAYAVNRKVLYNLITLKSAVGQKGSLQSSVLSSAKSDTIAAKSEVEKNQEEQVSVPPKFPPKKFTSNPDEWEAGMLRQLQLLHHWQQNQSAVGQSDIVPSDIQDSKFKDSRFKDSKIQDSKTEQTPEEKKPDAKEEINTLLYVLVEPGQSEDLTEETIEEIASENVSEEPETTQWEIKIAGENKTESETPIVVPNDPVQQEIIVEAIHSTFELEVDDKIPSVEELKPFRLDPIEEPVTATEKAEEVVVTGMEMSFSQWLQEVNKKVPSELPKTALSTDSLVEQFIKDEPRLNVKKSGFYNPVNMAKKSVQESDEFITETLARIYAKQGNHFKAIRAYEKLSLKFPEKTAYFAALIEELKRTPNK